MRAAGSALGKTRAVQALGGRPGGNVSDHRRQRALDDHGRHVLGRRSRRAGPPIDPRASQGIQAAGLFVSEEIRVFEASPRRKAQDRSLRRAGDHALSAHKDVVEIAVLVGDYPDGRRSRRPEGLEEAQIRPAQIADRRRRQADQPIAGRVAHDSKRGQEGDAARRTATS